MSNDNTLSHQFYDPPSEHTIKAKMIQMMMRHVTPSAQITAFIGDDGKPYIMCWGESASVKDLINGVIEAQRVSEEEPSE